MPALGSLRLRNVARGLLDAGAGTLLRASRRRRQRDFQAFRGSGRPIELDELVRHLAGGDRRAFERFYDRTAPYVFGLLLRILGDEGKADEVAQEVYLQAWRTAPRFDPDRGTALTWLAMIARSRAVDRARSDGSYGEALERLETGGSDQPLGSSGENPEEKTLRSERSRRVRGALEELPEEQRRAVELAFFRGMTHREIADRTETPLGTVKSRIRAGLSKLEEALDPMLRA